MINPRTLCACAFFAVVAQSTAAAAFDQPWLMDRRYREGIGIRTGNVEWHPGVAGEAGYDSNWFQRADRVNLDPAAGPLISEEAIDAFRFRITPSVSVSTLGPQRRAMDAGNAAPPVFDFRAHAAASYNEMIATDERFSQALPRFLSGNAGLALDILPMRPVGADVYGDYTRMVEPSNAPDRDFGWDRHLLRAGTGLKWRPGGGQFLWRAGYGTQVTAFEQDAWSNLSNVRHAVEVAGRWTFLPRTALVYRGELEFLRYFDRPVTLHNANPIRSQIGLNGLITRHLGLLVLGGWEGTFHYDDQDGPVPVESYDGPIGQAELSWYLTPQTRLEPGGAPVGLSSVTAGYARNVGNAYFSNFFVRDRGYARLAYLVGGFLLLSAEGGFSHITRPPAYNADGTVRFAGPDGGNWGENRVDATGFAEIRTSDTFGINATVRYDANLTANEIPLGNGFIDDLSFQRLRAWLGVRWFM